MAEVMLHTEPVLNTLINQHILTSSIALSANQRDFGIIRDCLTHTPSTTSVSLFFGHTEICSNFFHFSEKPKNTKINILVEGGKPKFLVFPILGGGGLI